MCAFENGDDTGGDGGELNSDEAEPPSVVVGGLNSDEAEPPSVVGGGLNSDEAEPPVVAGAVVELNGDDPPPNSVEPGPRRAPVGGNVDEPIDFERGMFGRGMATGSDAGERAPNRERPPPVDAGDWRTFGRERRWSKLGVDGPPPKSEETRHTMTAR